MNSQRFTLNGNDFVIWSKQVALFFAPTLLIVLISAYTQQQTGHVDWNLAWGAGYGSLLTSAIDLTKRFIANG